jgi:hypothetical protein
MTTTLDRIDFVDYQGFCKTEVVVVVPVGSTVRIACFYLVSVQFNPLPFGRRAGPVRLKKGRGVDL